jgi:hypothetical protein
MLVRNTNPATGDGGARRNGVINGTAATNSHNSYSAQALRAVIIGSHQATANGTTVRGRAPVPALCRALIEAGHDPATPLEAYRGSTLCLRVRSLGEGAKLTVEENDRHGPRFVTYRAFQDRARPSGGHAPAAQPVEGVPADPPTQNSAPEARGMRVLDGGVA